MLDTVIYTSHTLRIFKRIQWASHLKNVPFFSLRNKRSIILLTSLPKMLFKPFCFFVSSLNLLPWNICIYTHKDAHFCTHIMRATIHHHRGLRSLPGSGRPQGMELGQQRPPSRNLRRSVVVMRVTTDERVVVAAPRDKTVYKDNWFDRLAIHHLSSAIEATTGYSCAFYSLSISFYSSSFGNLFFVCLWN